MDFKIQAPFEPAGDQPQAIAKLAEGVEQGLRAFGRVTPRTAVIQRERSSHGAGAWKGSQELSSGPPAGMGRDCLTRAVTPALNPRMNAQDTWGPGF